MYARFQKNQINKKNKKNPIKSNKSDFFLNHDLSTLVCINTAGREMVGDAWEIDNGICGPSQEDGVCRRFGQNSREQTSTTGSVGGMEGGVQEARTWVGHQREELTISLEGKEIKQVDGFVYLR